MKVKASHILAKHSVCLEAIERIKAGESFASIAKQVSECPSRKRGGNLGFITKQKIVPEFWNAVIKLKPGEMTQEPIKTQFGWHVIKRTA